MGRAVGIELTESSARILSLEQNGKKSRILQFHEAPIPHDPAVPWEARAAAALKQGLSDAKIPRGRVVCALDSGDAILREVSLPFKGDEQIRKTVRFEMESLIHNYTIEQLVVAHYKTGETDKGSLLLAAAVPKTVIAGRLKLYQEAGVDPVALDLDVCAVYGAMLHAGAIDPVEPHLLVYGTAKFTKLVLVEEGRPRSIRTIRFSMTSAPRAAAAAGKSDDLPGTEEAIVLLSEEESRQFGELDRETQQSLVGILSKEISRFLLGNAASANPAHILLSGAFEDRAAAEMLQAATRIPVRTFNLVEALDADQAGAVRDRSSAMGVALGLALKGAGVDPLGMDFRQDEFQYRRKFEAIRNTAAITAQLVIIFLAAIALHFYFRRIDAEKALKTVLSHHEDLYFNVTGETVEPRQAYPMMVQKAQGVRDQQGLELPIRSSAREAWRDLFRALEGFQRKFGLQKLGEADLLLVLESVDVAQNTAPGSETLTTTLRGRIRNLEFAGAMRNEVRAQALFRNAEWVGNMDVDENGLYRFTLRSQWAKGK
ncbi:MAG TPA: hypothetical protein VJB14_13075 [Planctomycetota bacterium]|nr:hypothetical protein [Planctomycetota bacterium]